MTLNLFTPVGTLATDARGKLPLQAYMLDDPHTALQALILSLTRMVFSGTHGLIAIAAPTVAANVITIPQLLAVVRGVPVVLIGASANMTGLQAGTKALLVVSADGMTTTRTSSSKVNHQMILSQGVLRIIPGALDTYPAVPADAVLVAKFSVGDSQIVPEAVTVALRDMAELRNSAYSKINPAPLSTDFAPAVALPAMLARTLSWGGAVPGLWQTVTPLVDTYLAGVEVIGDFGPPDGELRQLVLYRVQDQLVQATSGFSAVQGGAVQCRFAQPVKLVAGTAYVVAMRGNGTNINSGGNTTPVAVNGFTIGSGGIWWNTNAIPSDVRGGTTLPFKLLVSPGVIEAGVTGRLGLASLPRFTQTVALQNGEAYLLALPGSAPELRVKEGGTEYKAALTPV